MSELMSIIEILRQRHIRRKADVILMQVRMDAEEKPDRWITTEEGHHVPLDKNGIALAGGGGTLKGVDFSGSKSKNSGNKKSTNSGKKPTTSTTAGAKVSTEKKLGLKADNLAYHRVTNKDLKSLSTMPNGTVIKIKDAEGGRREYISNGDGTFCDFDHTNGWKSAPFTAEKVKDHLLYGAHMDKIKILKSNVIDVEEEKKYEGMNGLSLFGLITPKEHHRAEPLDGFRGVNQKDLSLLHNLPKNVKVSVCYDDGSIAEYVSNGFGKFGRFDGNGDYYTVTLEELYAEIDDNATGVKITKLNGAEYNPKKIKAETVFSPGDDAFSAERKANAINTEDPTVADNLYRDDVGEIYRNMDRETKDAFNNYTGPGYVDINDGLRNAHNKSLKSVGGIIRDQISRMTDTIAKCVFKHDTFIPRMMSVQATNDLFGLDRGLIENATNEELQALVGRTGTDKGFMSCGSTMGKGAGWIDAVTFKIFCPKGTVGMYVEPFSKTGDGAGYNWDGRLDGKSKQSVFSHTQETILQRGTTLRITGIKKDKSGRVMIEAEVVKQEVEELSWD